MPQNLKTLTRKKDWWDVFGRTEPPPYSIDFLEYGIPAAVSAAWDRPTEGRTLNENGKWEAVAPGKPRFMHDYGGNRLGVLVEGGARTNYFSYSHDLTSGSLLSGSPTSHDSILGDSYTAYSVSTSEGDRYRFTPKAYTGNKETFSFIAEKNSSSPGTQIRFFSDSGKRYASYHWNNDSVSYSRNGPPDVSFQGARTLTMSGPNGSEVRRIVFQVDNGSGTFQLDIGPGGLIVHQFQVEEEPNASTLIITNGSSKTRAGDSFSIFSGGAPTWWNGEAGTWLMGFTSRQYETSDFNRILRTANNEEYITLKGAGSGQSVGTYDGTNGANVGGNTNSSFVPNRAAISINQSEQRLSVNGGSDTADHNGNLLDPSGINVPGGPDTMIAVQEIHYLPADYAASDLDSWTNDLTL